MPVLHFLSRRLAYVVLLAFALLSVPALADSDKDRKEWEKERREAIKEEEKARREWEKERRKAIMEAEKDRRKAEREFEKDRREAEREAAKYRRGRDREYGRYDDWEEDDVYNRSDRRYGRYGDSRGVSFNRLAQSQGYRDGFEKGREDWRKNRSASPARHGRYHDADRGYKSEYGSKERYRMAYRDGFEQGYDEGFGQFSRYSE